MSTINPLSPLAEATPLIAAWTEAGIFVAPSLYGPAGGLSGRSTFAVVVWVVAWGVLHARWQERTVAVGQVFGWTLFMIAIAVVATYPPLWALL